MRRFANNKIYRKPFLLLALLLKKKNSTMSIFHSNYELKYKWQVATAFVPPTLHK